MYPVIAHRGCSGLWDVVNVVLGLVMLRFLQVSAALAGGVLLLRGAGLRLLRGAVGDGCRWLGGHLTAQASRAHSDGGFRFRRFRRRLGQGCGFVKSVESLGL